jgi:hypothetical protein
MPTQPDQHCYPLVETNQPQPPTTQVIEHREGTHTGCGVCRLVIDFDDDDGEMQIVIVLPAGALAPDGLQATVLVTTDAGEARRYAVAPAAVSALEPGRPIRWALPGDAPRPAALVISFVYWIDDATQVSHDRIVSLGESARLAPAAE